MLDELADVYPDALSRAELAKRLADIQDGGGVAQCSRRRGAKVAEARALPGSVQLTTSAIGVDSSAQELGPWSDRAELYRPAIERNRPAVVSGALHDVSSSLPVVEHFPLCPKYVWWFV